MHPQADGFLGTLNIWIDTPQVFSGLIGAAITGVVGLLISAYVGRRRLGYTVLYDQPVNQGEPGKRSADGDPSPRMWEIVYRDQATAPNGLPVTDASLVVLRLRNIGWRTIKDDDFNQGKFEIEFAGRFVVHFKIRDNREYHKIVDEAQQPGSGTVFGVSQPGVYDEFALPATTLERGEGFEVLALLVDNKDKPDQRPKVKGHIAGGKIREYGRAPRRWRYAIALLTVAALTAAGVIVGVKIANRGLALSPVCAQGQLTVEGSTAFAPIFNQVVAEYEQRCPGAEITVRATGSVAGLADLRAAGNTPMIAMYDGLPAEDPGLVYDAMPVGDVIFAVVGNRSLQQQKAGVFTPGDNGGMTRQQIADAYLFPGNGDYRPAGRADNSGTRQVFAKTVLSGYDDSDRAEAAAAGHACDQSATAPSPGGVCLAQTTMDVLRYVSDTPDAIGYAEDDALTFFPNVAAIPVNGYAPTRANALDGNYKFLTTERLYTDGPPTGLAADLIRFLGSAPVTAQLRATSFIACADLSGSHLTTDCHPT